MTLHAEELHRMIQQIQAWKVTCKCCVPELQWSAVCETYAAALTLLDEHERLIQEIREKLEKSSGDPP